MDRAYLDFERLHRFHLRGSVFVLRAKSDIRFRRRSSQPRDRISGLICDPVVRPDGVSSATGFPDRQRRFRDRIPERDKALVVPTNMCGLSAKTVADIYRSRWQAELSSTDQAVPAHEVVPGHFGQSRENPDPGRRLPLRAGGHHQESDACRFRNRFSPDRNF